MPVHSLGVQKTSTTGIKGCVFGDGHKFWKKDGGKLRKNMQKHVFRVYFYAWKICY